MPLGPLPYEVKEVVTTTHESVGEYYIHSEVCELHGSDGLYGVMVLVVGNSLTDKLKRVLSFREEIPESTVEKEFKQTTRDGIDVALSVREDLQDEARQYIENEL